VNAGAIGRERASKIASFISPGDLNAKVCSSVATCESFAGCDLNVIASEYVAASSRSIESNNALQFSRPSINSLRLSFAISVSPQFQIFSAGFLCEPFPFCSGGSMATM
jgi:hypothetical protein